MIKRMGEKIRNATLMIVPFIIKIMVVDEGAAPSRYANLAFLLEDINLHRTADAVHYYLKLLIWSS